MDFLKESVSPLKPLSRPVYFISKELSRFQDLIDKEEMVSNAFESFKRCVSGPDIWAIQSYVNLKQRGLDVYLTDHFIPGEICVSPYIYLEIKDFPYNSFVVATRTDTARPAICELQSVMNHKAIEGPNDFYLTHWPQPLLIPRLESRGTAVENIDFKGHPRNIISPFKSENFQQQLAKLGMKFLFNQAEYEQHEKNNTQFLFWADYSQSDVLIAVRNLTEYDFSLKPSLKLINAWRARVPAILGPEPAYQHVRKSELDYIEATTADDVMKALQKLKSDPALYQAMVDNGVQRAKEFTPDCVAQEWRAFLNDQVIPAYERWQAHGVMSKKIARPVQFFIRSLQHKKNLKYHIHHRDNGPRPVSG